MERTRLCIVTDAWLPQVNGVVTTLTNLVEQAEKDNWEVLVIHPGLFKNYSAPGYPEIKLSWPYGLKAMIKDFKPHHLHIATEGPLGLRARISFRNNTFTTAYHTCWPEFLKNIFNIPESITWRYVKWFHGNNNVMVPTDGIRSQLYRKNVSKNVSLFSRGVNLENLKPTISHRPSDQKIKLLCVSRISKEKNLDAFCSLNPKKYELVLVGNGPYFDELKKKYPWVYFLGTLKGRDLANEYVNAECFVFPSLTDTFGLVMIEAQSLGTPVAAFPVNGPIDVILPETGVMDKDLDTAIEKALMLNRNKCMNATRNKFNWPSAWKQFKLNLIDHKDDTSVFFLNI
jgi:glycosyltransferase involved in cell wall biosynthesis